MTSTIRSDRRFIRIDGHRYLIFLLLSYLALFVSPLASQTTGDRVVDEIGVVTRAFAIRNATIVQAPGRTIDRGTVVVRNGLIVAVGANVSMPPDAEVIDGEGMVVYAGFIDGMSSAGVDLPRLSADSTKVARPGEPPRTIAGIQPDRDVRHYFDPMGRSVDSLREAGFTFAHVVPSGGMLPGTGAYAMLGGSRTGSVVLPRASLVAGFDPAREVYPATRMAIMAVWRTVYRRAQESKDRVTRYSRSPEGRSRPTSDPVLEAFYPVIDKTIPVAFAAEDALQLSRALRIRSELGFNVIVTGLRDPRDAVPLLRREKVPVFLSLDLPRDRAADKESDSVASGVDTTQSATPVRSPNSLDEQRVQSFKDVEAERQRLDEERRRSQRSVYRLPMTLAENDVRFGFGTSGTSAAEVRDNLRTLVRMGLSRERALAALTTDAASMLGVQRSLGTVEAGRIANLVVVNGDYFSDTSEVKLVVVDGVRYPITSTRDSSRRRGGQAKQSPEPGDSLAGNAALRARSGEATGGTIVIRNGTVLTITNGTLYETDVLVRSGRIAAIGKKLEVPAGTRVVDATGRFVMPGIIDAHSHLGIDDVNEWTNPVTAEVSVGDVVNPYDISIYRALAGGVTVSHAMHGSANAIGGECQTIKHRFGVADPTSLIMEGAPRTIKFALGENPTRVHGRGNGVTPSTRMGVEQVFRRAFTEARTYADGRSRSAGSGSNDPSVDPPAYDRRLETLSAILKGDVLVHCHSYRADEILMLMRVLKDFGVRRVVFQHVNEGFKVAPELADFGAMASVFADWWAYKFEVYYSTAYNASILTRNGVVTSINSDSPELTRHLYHEAAKTMKYGGLSEDEALALITINPARQLGIESRVGSIEVGKDGDIAIFSARPTSVYTRCVTTIVDGIVRFDAESDPDDMRMRIDPRAPAPTATVWEQDLDACMEGAE